MREYEEIFAAASKAAQEAGDKNEASGYFGGCGFAYVTFTGKRGFGNTKFAKWLKANGAWAHHGAPGLDVSSNKFYNSGTQSVVSRYNAAVAFAQVWKDAGYDCYAWDRLD